MRISALILGLAALLAGCDFRLRIETERADEPPNDGRLYCKIDDQWFPARDDGVCYAADAPQPQRR